MHKNWTYVWAIFDTCIQYFDTCNTTCNDQIMVYRISILSNNFFYYLLVGNISSHLLQLFYNIQHIVVKYSHPKFLIKFTSEAIWASTFFVSGTFSTNNNNSVIIVFKFLKFGYYIFLSVSVLMSYVYSSIHPFYQNHQLFVIKFFILSSYHLLNVCSICSDVFSFLLDICHFCFLWFLYLTRFLLGDNYFY